VPLVGSFLVAVNAFVFALLASTLIYLFSRLRGVSAETMLLLGIALVFLFNALLALLEYVADPLALQQVVFWTLGSLSKATWPKVAVSALVLVATAPLFASRVWKLTALRLGDDKARSLGIDVERLRLQTLMAVSLLAAASVAFVGTIGFVGLVGPHVARMLVGEDQAAAAVVSGLRIEKLRFSYGRRPVLHGIDVDDLPPGRVTAAIGPNAAGKSTLFKCIAGLLRPEGGVWLDGRDLRRASRDQLSRLVTYLPQEKPVAAVLTVFEAVLLARQQSASWRVTDEDLSAVSAALADVQISELAPRYLNELSGGQKQLVSIAQALVRSPRVLLMDEPTSNLDLQRQLEVLSLMGRVTAERGLVTLIALHDLQLAARHSDHFLVMSAGTLHAAGPPASVLTPAMLAEVYGVEARVGVDEDGRPRLTTLRSLRE
jgi:iron complex transport system ATP-binding protein